MNGKFLKIKNIFSLIKSVGKSKPKTYTDLKDTGKIKFSFSKENKVFSKLKCFLKNIFNKEKEDLRNRRIVEIPVDRMIDLPNDIMIDQSLEETLTVDTSDIDTSSRTSLAPDVGTQKATQHWSTVVEHLENKDYKAIEGMLSRGEITLEAHDLASSEKTPTKLLSILLDHVGLPGVSEKDISIVRQVIMQAKSISSQNLLAAWDSTFQSRNIRAGELLKDVSCKKEHAVSAQKVATKALMNLIMLSERLTEEDVPMARYLLEAGANLEESLDPENDSLITLNILLPILIEDLHGESYSNQSEALRKIETLFKTFSNQKSAASPVVLSDQSAISQGKSIPSRATEARGMPTFVFGKPLQNPSVDSKISVNQKKWDAAMGYLQNKNYQALKESLLRGEIALGSLNPKMRDTDATFLSAVVDWSTRTSTSKEDLKVVGEILDTVEISSDALLSAWNNTIQYKSHIASQFLVDLVTRKKSDPKAWLIAQKVATQTLQKLIVSEPLEEAEEEMVEFLLKAGADPAIDPFEDIGAGEGNILTARMLLNIELAKLSSDDEPKARVLKNILLIFDRFASSVKD